MVYRIAPISGSWVYRPIYRFARRSDGANQQCTLTVDREGNLFGTTINGGSQGFGTVFEITLPPGSSPTETVLYSFRGDADGAYPTAGLVFDRAGNLYGTTSGGTGGPAYQGAVFQLTPPAQTGEAWGENVLHLFGESDDGGVNPAAAVIFGKLGELYGTDPSGGANGLGVVFQMERR